MKKLFLFATVAAVGLFASCSSTDDSISEAANNPTEEGVGEDANQAVRIGINSPISIDTRGTGTVGGVGVAQNDATNAWAGQKIRVFMFKKIDDVTKLTLATEKTSTGIKNLYNNTEMITPGSSDNKIPTMSAALATGEAMISNGDIRYYPMTGNFDFFGYHGYGAVVDANDDADITQLITKSNANDLWTVPFTITGSEDLMSTKAEPTTDEITALGAGHADDFYCARAARKGVHPTLTFKHLLSRLSFKAIAGLPDAAGTYAAGKLIKTKDEWEAMDASEKAKYNVKSYDMSAAKITDAIYDGLTPATLKDNWNSTSVGGFHAWAGNTVISKDDFDALGATADQIDGEVVKLYVNNVEITDENYAVKVKEIRIWSNTTGNLAVAWTAAAATSYEVVGVLTKTAYDALTRSGFGDDWIAIDAIHPEKGYRWNATNPVTAEKYATLEASEKFLCVNTSDKTKISDWANPAWLTLKARPYAKKKDGAAANAIADFKAGSDLRTQLDQLKLEYDAIDALVDGDPGFDTKTQDLADKQEEIDAILAFEGATISQAIFEQLTDGVGGAQDKYDVFSGNTAQKEDLIALTPVAATTAGAQVGEALLVQPKEADYVMEVTIQQRVITNWVTPDQPTYGNKEVTYRLNIKQPTGGFKLNTSYEIQLTVYSLQRIDVITVISPWVVDTDDIVLEEY